MAKENAGSAAAAGDGQRHMTLTEVAKRTGFSMPTLQKYKKRYGDRIPSVGKGRKQRYPEESLPVFKQLREENMARRGRPRKNPAAAASPAPAARRRGRPRKAASASGPATTGAGNGRRRGGAGKAAAAAAAASQGGGGGLLTLTQVAQETKVSYPTLLRYVKTSLARIPHVGKGRRRRYKPEAVPVFLQLRGESRRGRKPGTKTAARRGRPPGSGKRRGRPPGSGRAASAVDAGFAGVVALLARLEKRLARVESELKKPLRLVRR